jgi:hypothetical protein
MDSLAVSHPGAILSFRFGMVLKKHCFHILNISEIAARTWSVLKGTQNTHWSTRIKAMLSGRAEKKDEISRTVSVIVVINPQVAVSGPPL